MANTPALDKGQIVEHPDCERQRQDASEWMKAIGWLPRSYEPELHGIVEDAFKAGYEAAALRRETPAAEGWRDISTVPRDHHPVLAWSIKTGPVVAFQDVAWTWWPCPASYPLRDKPTHWRPLPPRPSEQAADVAAGEQGFGGNPPKEQSPLPNEGE